MTIRWKRESLILFLGDIFCFAAAFFLTLLIRYNGLPDPEVLRRHELVFSGLFLLWAISFFVAGLYDKQTNALKRRLLALIFQAQAANLILAVAVFYFATFFKITPKVNLLIDFIFSTIFIAVWRLYLVDRIAASRVENVLFVGDNPELNGLKAELSKNPGYRMRVLEAKSFNDPIFADVPNRIFTVVADLRNLAAGGDAARLPELLFAQVKFIDFRDLYEEVFDRVPLSTLSEAWILENISNQKKLVYDSLKRAMDLSIAIIVGLITLPLYPLIWLAIKFDDGGAVFIFQDRIGRANKAIRVIKFRSMKASDGGKWLTKDDKRITKVGKFLRKTRIDELPQLWSVIKGDLSLIGPRPDIDGLGRELHEQIPYYAMRNLLKSGLSGWAQVHQELPPQSLAETRARLAYDFYYLKNRSLTLDLEIALRTIKTLLSRGGL